MLYICPTMRPFLQISTLFLLLLISSSQTTGDGTVSRLLEAAKTLLDSARYDLALQQGQQALQQCEPGTPDAAACLLFVGDVFLEMGAWEAAFQQYQAALAIYSQKSGLRDLATAEALNRLGEYFYKKTDYSQAATFYQKALQIREAALGSWHERVADGYNNLGNCQVGQGDYAAASKLHQKALDIRLRVLPKGHADLATSYNNLGNCMYLLGDYSAALQYFENALDIRKKVFGSNHPKTAQVHNNLGNVYAAMGLRDEAIGQYRRAIEIRRAHFGDQHPGIASAIENIADLYLDNGDYILALDFFKQAYNIQQRLQEEGSTATATLWHKIGLCYQYEGDFSRALEHHLAVAPLLEAAFGADHPLLGGLYNNLGNCYSGTKNYKQALLAYHKALKIFQRKKSAPSSSLALVYNNLGNAYLENNEAVQALSYFQKALERLDLVSAENASERAVYLKNTGLALDRLNRFPEAQTVFQKALEVAKMADPMTEVTVLDGWATLLRKRGAHSQDTALLRQSIAVFGQSRHLSDSLRALLSNPGSRQRWLELQFPANALAMEACYGLWEINQEPGLLEQAFSLAERNKSMQLLEHLRKEQAEQTAGIPDTLLAQERHLRAVLNSNEKALLALQQPERSAAQQAAETAVAGARQALMALLQTIETQYPDYYRLKYDRNTVTPKAIQQQLLQTGQALIEYFVSDNAIFVFVVTSSDFRCLRLERNFPLDAWVTALRHSLQAYPNAGESAAEELSQAYMEQASQLYEAIFAPIQKAVQLPEKLIIVPDGTLAYMPFECLLREPSQAPNQFKNHHYLIRDYCFSYAYSATQQLALLQTKPRKLPHNLLAVAPDYAKDRYGLSPLENNGQEAEAVADMFGGKLLAGAAATVPAFTQNADQYRILLLAMHGKASSGVGDMSYIAFSTVGDTAANPFLYTRDLYTLSIPADLVVLSACETSVGSYRFGQGVISLAKGFFQAGARSVAATLWSVDDASNAELMRLFFKEIKNGSRKDDALRKAKLKFLDTHPHAEANPVYWAAVTAYGDMGAVEMGAWGYWWLLVIGVVFGVLWWYLAKK